MRRWPFVLFLIATAACSGLDEGEGGVVALEVQIPEILTVEVNEQVQLSARALDADGEVVDAPILWQADDDALTVSATGLVTGVTPGTSQVQAVVGALSSETLDFTVIAPADTLVIVGDSVLTVDLSVDPPAAVTMNVRLDSRSPAGPAGPTPVIFEITRPVAGETPVVQLAGAVQSDTLTTNAAGTIGTSLSLVTGQVPPDTAIVLVRANRTRGAPVPGSGQRFIVLFQ